MLLLPLKLEKVELIFESNRENDALLPVAHRSLGIAAGGVAEVGGAVVLSTAKGS